MLKESFSDAMKRMKVSYPDIYEDAKSENSLIKRIVCGRAETNSYMMLFSLLDELGMKEYRDVCRLALDIDKSKNFVIIPGMLGNLDKLEKALRDFSTHIQSPIGEFALINQLQYLEQCIASLHFQDKKMQYCTNECSAFINESKKHLESIKRSYLNFVDYEKSIHVNSKTYDGENLKAYYEEILGKLRTALNSIESIFKEFNTALEYWDIYVSYTPLIAGFIESAIRLGLNEE